jgi:hypothetical protein
MSLWRMAVVLAVCIASSALAPATVIAADKSPFPKLDIGRGGKCVDDLKFMRKNHMDLIKHQRDETVHQGIRGGKYSLAACVDCHASKKNNSVLGSNENFCQGCHVYVQVKIDCFECHSSKRKVVAEAIK